MKVLNSSTNKLVDLKEPKVTIYNCGPTVYNYVHIGNVRPLIVFDVLHRYLLATGTKVEYVQNITDVDDKIIKAAKDAGISEKELADKYTKAYQDLFGLLNVKKLIMPRVSDHIKDIQDYVQKLIDAGAAYIVDGDVYFNISKAKDYGHVSRQNIQALLDGVRKENKANKHNPLDFVLWKKTDEGINWKSPWSKGRPGWHTECCVLINKHFGDHVTIHGGGVDLKFPHHENENAQHSSLFGRDIADIWMHVGHINVDGAKMAKSLGNFILVKDIITKDNAPGLRWFFYQAKYQQPANFTANLLTEATKEVDALFHSINTAKTYAIAANTYSKKAQPMSNEFAKALADDLNLPNAITVLNNEVKQLNIAVRAKDFNKASALLNVIETELDILGLKNDKVDFAALTDKIKEWKQATDSKDFAKADKLRAELADKKAL